MKKTVWLALIFMLLCAFALSACDNVDTSPNNDDNGQETTVENNSSGQETTVENSDSSEEEDNSSDNPSVCQHTFGEWSIVKNATCKEEGKLSRTCDKCSETEEASIKKSETHTVVIDAAVSATCNKTGLTEGSHCSVCNTVLVKQSTVSKRNHVFAQQKITPDYIRTKATTSAAATYYYACVCGLKGQKFFSYGSPISVSDNSGWTSCNKTVYSVAQTYFYIKPNSTSVCGTCKAGNAIQVVSTDGKWYKVSANNPYSNCEAYIKCSDVTVSSSIGVFVNVPDGSSVAATIKDQFKATYLYSDASGSSASRVGEIGGSGYITVVAVNKSKTWAKVYYYGPDKEGRTYDGSKLYYCSLEEIKVMGLPDNWP